MYYLPFVCFIAGSSEGCNPSLTLRGTRKITATIGFSFPTISHHRFACGTAFTCAHASFNPGEGVARRRWRSRKTATGE